MTEACSVAPAEILAFWRAAGRGRWYEQDDTFDADVRSRFLELWRKAAAGELSSWEITDEGALALVIILDQFPRNMFRGDIRTYSSDALAREVAGRAIASWGARRRRRNRPFWMVADFGVDDGTVNAQDHCRFRGAEYCARRLPGLRHIRTVREN